LKGRGGEREREREGERRKDERERGFDCAIRSADERNQRTPIRHLSIPHARSVPAPSLVEATARSKQGLLACIPLAFADQSKPEKGPKRGPGEGEKFSVFQFQFFFDLPPSFFVMAANLFASAREKVTSLISAAGGEPEPEPEQGLLGSLQTSFAEATQMSRTNRYLAAGTLLGVGVLFGALSSLFVVVSPRKFAALYTLSNLCGLGATMFVVGPAKQCAKMAEPTRLAASAVYLSSAVLTLVAALKLRSLVLTLLFALVQFLALIWYVLSYVPYARTMFSGAVSSCLGGGEL
jgi:hypothetical protein